MYFDDTTTNINVSSFDEDRILILDGKQRLKYFSDNYRLEPVRSPLSEKRLSFFKKIKRLFMK